MHKEKTNEKGFSLIEMIFAMTIALVMLGGITTLLAGSMTTRKRENDRTQALGSAQKALNILSRELANSGFGLLDNGIVTADSNNSQIRFRANLDNTNETTSDANEDLTYTFDAQNRSIIRFDRRTGISSVVASGVTQMTVSYQDYEVQNNGSVIVQLPDATPSANTAKIKITIALELEQVINQPKLTTTLVSEVSLRNSGYVLDRY